MKVLTIEEADEWNEIVKSFKQWDVYYLCEYAKSLQLHGDGVPLLFYVEYGNRRLCYVAMKVDIAQSSVLKQCLPENQYFDMEVPYGYGGALVSEEWDENANMQFEIEWNEYCKTNKIVSQFFRFHPLMGNYNSLGSIVEYKYLKDTIYIDTSDKDIVVRNMDTKNRNMVRKAQKVGVSIFKDRGENLTEFIQIYNETMDRTKASDYYYFDRNYFMYLINTMKQNIIFFYAMLDGEIIASAMFFYNERYMHYHLSGAKTKYMKMAPTNLLLYEAAIWAADRGIEKLHLGGGVESEDSLFQFKKKFNKNGRCKFWIGKKVFDQNAYDKLLRLRKEMDPSFDIQNSFMIQYRR